MVDARSPEEIAREIVRLSDASDEGPDHPDSMLIDRLAVVGRIAAALTAEREDFLWQVERAKAAEEMCTALKVVEEGLRLKCEAAKAELDRLRTELAAMAEALEPFAYAAGLWDQPSVEPKATVGDFRRARRVLANYGF